ncbi:family 10 glycosylhydrolase [candidate division KSB1 bacterium]|nr:family 10 glycosylhydrolase [candidate division KSB1 bacterium]
MVRRAIGWMSVFALFCAGLQPLSATETRALWVTRWEYQSPKDLQRIVENAASARFNTLLFQVRGNGTVYYPSKLEIWSEKYQFSDPGWDPLRLAIDLAHANEMTLHAWINVYPGWKNGTVPDNGGQLYFTHPDWFVKDQTGLTYDRRAEYLWLSPTHPQVTDYLVNLCRELMTTYRIDGIHFDYLRYPSPAVSYDEMSVERFRLYTGAVPNQEPEKWTQWRRDAITDFLTRVAADVSTFRPELILSAAVFGDYSKGLRVHLQESHTWVAKGILDVLYPMIYTNEDTLFTRYLLEHRQNDHGRHIYPGIYAPFGSAIFKHQRIAQELGCKGMALLSYSSLFPDHRPGPLVAGLEKVWDSNVKPATLPWKELRRDTQGPQITQVQTIPGRLEGQSEFRIAARIIDPSGVYDDDTGSDGYGVYLVYDRTWPPQQKTEIRMSRVKDSGDWFIADRAIPPQETGLDFRCRIFAWDDYHESAGHAKRNLGYSDVWSLSILTADQTFISRGSLGPTLWRPLALAVDGQGKIWIATAEGMVVILNPDGTETDFSPLTVGWTARNEPVRFEGLSSLAFSPPHLMLVAAGKGQQHIFRFESRTGKVLPGIDLDFTASAIDCDDAGNIFALENGTTRFHVLTPTGIDLKGSPFGGLHVSNDIAVLHNASMVLISDRSSDAVQCWHGAVEGERVRYWPVEKLKTVDVGMGKVVTASNDLIYVPHTPRGVISIFNRSGRLQSYLSDGNPLLHTPLDIGISVTGDTLYVLEMAGDGPIKLSLWIKSAGD